MRRSSISATIRWMRSASLLARAASTMALFLVVEEPLPGGQQLDFGAFCDQAFAGVHQRRAVGRGGGDHRHPDLAAPVQVVAAGLGHRDAVPALEFGHDGPHDGTLLLQGADVAQQQVQRQGSDEHALTPWMSVVVGAVLLRLGGPWKPGSGAPARGAPGPRTDPAGSVARLLAHLERLDDVADADVAVAD